MNTAEPSKPARASYDVLVLGGGPAGSTFANLMRREGFDVLLVEKDQHPRFVIGESLLPGTMPVWRELGIADELEDMGFLRKYGAYFCFADGNDPHFVAFPDATRVDSDYAFQVRRADFDLLLWKTARATGVECIDRVDARRVTFEGSRATGAELVAADGTEHRVRARLVADCTGRGTLVARQSQTRTREPELDKVALYAHYQGLLHSTGTDAGTIGIIAAPFGWAWVIPFGDGHTSVGITMEQSWYAAHRRRGHDNEAVWDVALRRLPALARRLAGATRVRPIEATADFQYTVRDVAGDGWVLIGDSSGFVDPIFSSGVHLAMAGARRASRAARVALAGDRLPGSSDFARYVRKNRASQRVFSKFIHAWYDPAFREIFIHPPDNRAIGWLRGEIASVLAGAESPSWRALPIVHLLIQLSKLHEKRQGGEKTLLPKDDRDRARRLRLSARRRAERQAARQSRAS